MRFDLAGSQVFVRRYSIVYKFVGLLNTDPINQVVVETFSTSIVSDVWMTTYLCRSAFARRDRAAFDFPAPTYIFAARDGPYFAFSFKYCLGTGWSFLLEFRVVRQHFGRNGFAFGEGLGNR